MGKQNDAFIVPAGLVFQQVDGAIAIEHEGDIVLHGTLGQRLHSVRSTGGDVTLHVDADLVEVAAPAGSVQVMGDLTAESIIGRKLEVGGSLVAQGVYADAVNVLGDVQADKLIAQDGGIEIGGDVTVAGELAAGQGDVIVHGTLTADELRSEGGDITLHGAAKVRVLTAAGQITTHDALEVEQASAGADIRIGGEIVAEGLHADTVHLGGAQATLKVVQGRTAVQIESAQIQADIIIAPLVDISPQARGRITVVESHNEPGPSMVKGCLSLADLESMLGDVDKFLADRGIERLGEGELGSIPTPPVADEPALDEEEISEPVGDADTYEGPGVLEDEEVEEAATEMVEEIFDAEEEDEQPDVADLSDEFGLGGEVASDEDVHDDEVAEDDEEEDEVEEEFNEDDEEEDEVEEEFNEDDEEEEDEEDEVDDFDYATPTPADDPAEDEEPEEVNPTEQAPPPDEDITSVPVVEDDDDPVYDLMVETVGRITECYAGTDAPPAVGRLRELVAERAYDTIRDDITDIWNQLLKFHQKRGLRIQPQVTTTFNTINTIVRKM